VIDRAVSIASLPLNQLQQQRTALSNESSALRSLETKFASLRATVASIESTIGFGSYTTSLSNSSTMSASLSEGVVEGSYSVEVTSLGSTANTMSKDSSAGLMVVTDPSTQNISGATEYTLTVDGDSYQITPSSNTLNSLVEAINAATGANVRATAVNVGSPGSPDYRISLQSTNLGPVSIQLNDGTKDLLDQLTPGAKAKYKVNGMTTEIESDSRTVQLAPGLTIDLLEQSTPGEATTIEVKRSTASVSNSISAFVNAYNALVDEVNGHRGDSNGALRGQGVVFAAAEALQNIPHFSTGNSGLSSMFALGLSLDQNGKMSFDASAFSTAANGNFAELAAFLGTTTQSGFLKSTSDLLDSLEDTANGTIKASISTVDSAIVEQDARIAAEQERVEQTRARMEAQIAAADALIAQMEQQVAYFNGMWEAMRAANESLK
jgi:flagellar hook-associated protein 2